jgi:hypothetical protein
VDLVKEYKIIKKRKRNTYQLNKKNNTQHTANNKRKFKEIVISRLISQKKKKVKNKSYKYHTAESRVNMYTIQSIYC